MKIMKQFKEKLMILLLTKQLTKNKFETLNLAKPLTAITVVMMDRKVSV